jgi:hypothetical protein
LSEKTFLEKNMLPLESFLNQLFEQEFPEYVFEIDEKDFQGNLCEKEEKVMIKFFSQISCSENILYAKLKIVIFTPIFQSNQGKSCCFQRKPKECFHQVYPEWKFYPNERVMRFRNIFLPKATNILFDFDFPKELIQIILSYYSVKEEINELVVWSIRDNILYHQIEHSAIIAKCVNFLLSSYFDLCIVDQKGNVKSSSFELEFQYVVTINREPNVQPHVCKEHNNFDKKYFHGITNETPCFLTLLGLHALHDTLIQIKIEHLPKSVKESTLFDKYLIKRKKKGKIPVRLYFCFKGPHWG